MRVSILFIHIVGVLVLFAGLAIESVGLRQLRRSTSVGDATPWIALFWLVLRLYPAALTILLLTGGYLASNVGVWEFGWVRIPMATLVIITVVGIIAGLRVRSLYRRSINRAHAGGLVDGLRAPWLLALLSSRGAAALGIVFVMVAKPEGVPAFMVIVTAAVLAAAIARFLARRPANAATAASRGSDDIGDYAATNRQEA